MAHFGNDQVAVVERDAVDLDENVMVAEGGDWGGLFELDVVEAGGAVEGILLGGGWCHCVCFCICF